MESKFVIFLLVATAAQSSFAMTAAKLCAPLTDIGAKLAVIQFGTNMTRGGLTREADLVFTEVRTRVAQRAGRIYTDPKDTALRTAIALNETLTAARVGITPLIESILTFQPDTDVECIMQRVATELEPMIALYFNGIKLTEGKQYSKALAAIEKMEKKSITHADNFITAVFDALVNGTVKVSDESKAVIECVLAEAGSGLRNAASGFFDGIKHLLKVNFCKTEAEINNYASAIEDAYANTIAGFAIEIANKFAAIENLVVAEFLKKNGIVKGLVAMRSTS